MASVPGYCDTDYGLRGYWEARYRRPDDPECFEWYHSYEEVASILQPFLTAKPSPLTVLHVGCGTSLLGEKLWQEQVGHVINIDYSEAAIQRMKQRTSLLMSVKYNSECSSVAELKKNIHEIHQDPSPGFEVPREQPFALEYHQMDVRQLPFADQQFDIVLDKGTVDAMMCSVGWWDASPYEYSVEQV